MSEWSIVNLGDLIDYKKGYAFKSKYYDSDGDNIIVRVSDTTIDSINISTCHKIKSEYVDGLDDYRLQTDDVIIATVGSWADNPQSIVGKVIKVPKEADGSLLNQNAVRLRANGLLDQKYLFYSLRDNVFSSYLLNNAQGSANQASITLNDIFSYVFKLPTLPEQKAIAAVLSALDDKIDLLQRQNETLEKMAETLFRQWFIEEAKEDWEEVALSDYLKVKHGYAFKGEFITPEVTKYRLVTPGNFEIGGGFKSAKFKYYSHDSIPEDYIFDGLDFVVTMTDLSKEGDTLGYPAFVPLHDKSQVMYLHNQRVGKVLFHNKNECKFFFYMLMKQYTYQQFIVGFSTGTSVKHTSPTTIGSFTFAKPSNEKMKEFDDMASKKFAKIFLNQNQIQTLQNLRDTLLPKLMSGEVRVKLD